mgnify:CR=1 FL=1
MTASYLVWLVAAWLFLAATVVGFAVHAVQESRRRRQFERHVTSALSLLVQRTRPAVLEPGEYVISAGEARRHGGVR